MAKNTIPPVGSAATCSLPPHYCQGVHSRYGGKTLWYHVIRKEAPGGGIGGGGKTIREARENARQFLAEENTSPSGQRSASAEGSNG